MPKETPECGAFLYLYWCPPLRPVRFYSLPCFVFFFLKKKNFHSEQKHLAKISQVLVQPAGWNLFSACTSVDTMNTYRRQECTQQHLPGPYGSSEEGVLSVAQVDVAWRGLWSSVLNINASILLCYTNVLEDVTTGGNEQKEKILNLLGFILPITKGCIITSKAISYIGGLHLAHSTLLYKYLLKW